MRQRNTLRVAMRNIATIVAMFMVLISIYRTVYLGRFFLSWWTFHFIFDTGQKDNTDRNTPQAFSHFTYHESHHRLIIVDIQGVNDFYTDPQIHTDHGNGHATIKDESEVFYDVDNLFRVGFGLGNLGKRGMEAFLKSHKCNSICRYLNLPPVQTKDVDVGTKLLVRKIHKMMIQNNEKLNRFKKILFNTPPTSGHSKLDERSTYGPKRQNLEFFRKVCKNLKTTKDQVLC